MMRSTDMIKKIFIGRRIMLSILAVLLFALFSQGVLGFGLGPSRQYVTYTPGETVEGELYIMNTDKQDFKAGVYAEGDLADFIEFDESLFDISKNDLLTVVPYKITFPTKMPKPGDNKMNLVVRQFPKDDEMKGTVVKVNMAMIAELIVRVPYPGKYAEGKMFISNMEDLEESALFTIMVYNYGSEFLDEVKAHIDIVSPTGDIVGKADSHTRTLGAKEEVKLDLPWEKTVKMGTYTAKARVDYDDKHFEIERAFDLGIFTIELSDVKVDKFTLGDVAKFDIALMNNWNKMIEGVYSEVIITDMTGKEMTRFKTAAIDIPAEQIGKLEGYWYTEGVAPGEYEVKFIIHYDNKMTQKKLNILVDTNKIEFLGQGTGYAVTAGSGQGGSQGMLMILVILVVILLIVMNLVWFYFLAKKMKDK